MSFEKAIDQGVCVVARQNTFAAPRMNAAKPTIVWFRNDLRLADNSALAAAVRVGAPIVPLFIHVSGDDALDPPGTAARWWLWEALKRFAAQWAELDGGLIFRTGPSLPVLREILRATGAARVYWNRSYQADQSRVDSRIKRALRSEGIEVATFNSALLNAPESIASGSGRPYRVFTPYWKKARVRAVQPPEDPDWSALRCAPTLPNCGAVEDLRLTPTRETARRLSACWIPGEAAGHRRLDAFLDRVVQGYAEMREVPGVEGTSMLSPYLRWGHIGPRQIVRALMERHDGQAAGPATFLKELYWREFAYHVFYHFPFTGEQPLRPDFAAFPWRSDPEVLDAWRAGRTGYPIVDAGMRQLHQTGWMHNRVRMIVASFLVKHLLQDWRDGARWFRDQLVDADPANNTLGWQWAAGCGADAAPYFRIFNPILQGRKFDPDGAYVRRFVPELDEIDTAQLHAPWEASPEALRRGGVRLGQTYPAPIIAHKAARERALAAFHRFRTATETQDG